MIKGIKYLGNIFDVEINNLTGFTTFTMVTPSENFPLTLTVRTADGEESSHPFGMISFILVIIHSLTILLQTQKLKWNDKIMKSVIIFNDTYKTYSLL